MRRHFIPCRYSPNRNTISHANKVRPAGQLFSGVLDHLRQHSPRFASGKAGKRFARKFKRTAQKTV